MEEYIVELGEPQDYNYYSFHFNDYGKATSFVKILIENGYIAHISIEDEP